MKFVSKNVFISGASSGIGKACAEVFAENGANLVLFARRKDRLTQLKKELTKKYKVNVHIAQCDVRSFDEVQKAIKAIPKSFLPINLLINNAGLAKGLNKLHEGDLAHWEQMIDTNIKGLLYVSRLIIPQMAVLNEGMIINIGSIAGREIYPNGAVYCGTKHAVKAISKGMTVDLNGTGVRVANIEPGLVETEFSEVRFDGDKAKADIVYKGYQPLNPIDIAETAYFIATRPAHVMIQEVLITPTAQASAHVIDKKF